MGVVMMNFSLTVLLLVPLLVPLFLLLLLLFAEASAGG